jgi:hypothetical protein
MAEDTAAAPTPGDVAMWMVAQLKAEGQLSQPFAAMTIQDLFGDEFVYRDPFGYLAINRRVLYRFRKLTVDSVVWEVRDGNYFDGRWRLREFRDTPWRRQNVGQKGVPPRFL